MNTLGLYELLTITTTAILLGTCFVFLFSRQKRLAIVLSSAKFYLGGEPSAVGLWYHRLGREETLKALDSASEVMRV